MIVFLLGILITSFLLVMVKRITAMISVFRAQSFFLALVTLSVAVNSGSLELYAVAGLLFLLKVIGIPHYLSRIVKKVQVNENLGFFVNPMLSLIIAVLLTYFAYLFAHQVIQLPGKVASTALAISLSVTLIGLFVMISRVKALTQIVGLLVMENGLFLAAAAVSGGMPFFVEIAIFFDLMVCVIIQGIFVYRINKLFTHIDIDKLTGLRG